jgi:DsbC/DsbD-like thiol-disulfide interchange protein
MRQRYSALTQKSESMMNRLIPLTSALFLTASLGFAQEMPNLGNIVEIEMIPGWQLDDGGHMAALRVTLAPGWKTYWRVGGESGIPPHFDWTGSGNLSGVKFHWPRPDILLADGVEIIGYKNELILPIEFSPTTIGQEIEIAGQLELGVCKDICVPVKMPLQGAFGATAGQDSFLIELALADGAIPAPEAGYNALTCALTPIEDGYSLSATLSHPANAEAAKIITVEAGNPEIWVAPVVFKANATGLQAQTLLLNYGDTAFKIDPADIRITVISENQAVDIQGCPSF